MTELSLTGLPAPHYTSWHLVIYLPYPFRTETNKEEIGHSKCDLN